MRTRERTSTGRWRIGAWRRISRSWLSAVAVAASVCSCAPKVIVEPPPACPELTDEQFTLLVEQAPKELVDWYWNQFDPFCEALYDATRNHRE